MAEDQELESMVAQLELQVEKSPTPPAAVVIPPDSGDYIFGNRAGFLRLAIASMRAAQKQDQTFQQVPWIQDDDWMVRGLKFDEYAHLHLPEKKTKRQKMFHDSLGLLLGIAIMTNLVVGLVTIVHWIYVAFGIGKR
jgi:hypothetical protein